MQIQYRHLEYFESKWDCRRRLADDPFSNLKSSLLQTSCGGCIFFRNYKVSGFPQQHVLPKHSMLTCQRKSNHTKWEHSALLSSLPLLASGLFPLWLELKQIEWRHNRDNHPCNLNENNIKYGTMEVWLYS